MRFDARRLLTSNLVIAGSQQLQVSLSDKRAFSATLIGADPQTDLAVLQIQADKLPVAQQVCCKCLG